MTQDTKLFQSFLAVLMKLYVLLWLLSQFMSDPEGMIDRH